MVFTARATISATSETEAPVHTSFEQVKAMKNYGDNCGYALTLVEMLAVLAVITVLAAIVVAVGMHIETQSRERGLTQLFALLEAALQEYRDFKGYFPEQPERDFSNASAHSEYLYRELRSIPECRRILENIDSSFVHDYFDSGVVPAMPEIYDSWWIKDKERRRVLDYIYAADDSFPELISAGPDRIFGTADDIRNR